MKSIKTGPGNEAEFLRSINF